jgi:hypothetical protein
MSADFTTYGGTLETEIEDLKKYNVPKEVRERMLMKLHEIYHWNKEQQSRGERKLDESRQINLRREAVIDALGEYLIAQENRRR